MCAKPVARSIAMGSAFFDEARRAQGTRQHLENTMTTMDLNSDLGESLGAWTMGDDAAMLEIVSSANVACGFHAGDPVGILQTLRAAAARGVVVGAHVAYPDLKGFGRRNMDISSAELVADVIYHSGQQLGAGATDVAASKKP